MKSKKSVMVIVGVLILVLIVGGVLLLVKEKMLGDSQTVKPIEQTMVSSGTTEEPTQQISALPTEAAVVAVPSRFLQMEYPIELADIVVHETDIYGNRITDSFYMERGENDIPLFRIDFGDATAGDWVGMLAVEGGYVDVTSVIFGLSDEEHAGLTDEERETYEACARAYSAVMESIITNPNFTAEKKIEVGGDVQVKTTYWTLTLPSNMTVAETNENNTYVAMFYGDVAGERTALYTVHIGDDKAESDLGLFEVDGIKKPISIGSFDLSEKTNWTEDDYSAAYRMMDTINHMLETIMSSEQFSIPVEEPVQAQGA